MLKSAVKDEEHWWKDIEKETPKVSRITDTMWKVGPQNVHSAGNMATNTCSECCWSHGFLSVLIKTKHINSQNIMRSVVAFQTRFPSMHITFLAYFTFLCTESRIWVLLVHLFMPKDCISTSNFIIGVHKRSRASKIFAGCLPKGS
jgi:hypothetical protein